MKHLLLSATISLLTIIASAQCGPQLPNKYPLGAGLNGITDYSQDRIFNDVFKTHRSMSANTTQPWNYVAPTMDANGWPTQDFGTVVMTEMASTMGGTYKLRFNGQATLGTIASSCTIQNQTYDSGTNTTTADIVYPNPITSSNSLMLKFTNTQFSTGVAGVKNIQIMKPGLDFTAPTFSQSFTDHVSRFDCLRFMDWRNTNGNSDSLWANRKLTTTPTQTGSKGVAWEYCIELANFLNKDMWINVPHKADSAYIANLAQLVHSTLNPNLKVYIEHSNEVWNFGFAQASYNRDAALYEVANNPNSLLDYDGSTDQYLLAQRRHAARTKLISNVFKNVMGTQELNNRFRVMLGAQLFNFYSCIQGVSYINKHYGNPVNSIYGVAVAPYFNTEDADATNTATPQEVLDAMQGKIDGFVFPQFDNQVDLYAARCRYFGLKLLCYEGGPDTFGPNNIAAKATASRDPQMKDMCYNFLQKWYAYGFDGLFNWFTAGSGDYTTQYGTWSLTENFENSAKLQAIDSILNASVTNPTAGLPIPGTVDARKTAGYSSADFAAASFTPTGWKSLEEWLIRVPKDSAGDYTLIIETACNSANQKTVLSIDNQYIDTLNIPNNGSTTAFVSSQLYNIPFLNEGFHTFRLKYVVGNPSFNLRNFTFDLVTPCEATAIAEPDSKTGLTVYPNPASGEITVTKSQTFRDITITDVLGNVVLSQKNSAILNIQSLKSGIYFLKTDRGEVAKFVKE